MPITEADHTIRHQIRNDIFSKLCEAYPDLDQAALAKTADTCSNTLETDIYFQKQKTTFWTLSAELRNRIYALALKPDQDNKFDRKQYRWLKEHEDDEFEKEDDEPVIVLQSQEAEWNGYGDAADRHRWWLQPAMSRVCRQMRSETLPMWYGTTKFVAFVPGGPSTTTGNNSLKKRLRHIGQHLKLIKRFEVLYDDREWRPRNREAHDEKLRKETTFHFCKEPFYGDFKVSRKAIQVKVLREVPRPPPRGHVPARKAAPEPLLEYIKI